MRTLLPGLKRHVLVYNLRRGSIAPCSPARVGCAPPASRATVPLGAITTARRRPRPTTVTVAVTCVAVSVEQYVLTFKLVEMRIRPHTWYGVNLDSARPGEQLVCHSE